MLESWRHGSVLYKCPLPIAIKAVLGSTGNVQEAPFGSVSVCVVLLRMAPLAETLKHAKKPGLEELVWGRGGGSGAVLRRSILNSIFS